jgi:hypothetical protein
MLPELSVPTYIIEIPSTKEKIKIRCFLVKEEKILALALQDGEKQHVLNALKEVVTNCSYGKLDVSKLTSFDFEYIFLQLRSKSKTNIVELSFTCKNEIEGKPCNHVNKFNLDIDKAKVSDIPSTKIQLRKDKDIGIVLKFPNLDAMMEIEEAIQKNDVNYMYKNLYKFIDCAYEGQKVFTDFTPEQFEEWLGQLNSSEFAKIEKFFSNLPKLTQTFDIQCGKCGYKEGVTLEGLQSFLD